MGLRSIVLSAAVAAALFSPTLVEARGGGGGHSSSASVSTGTSHASAGQHAFATRIEARGGGGRFGRSAGQSVETAGVRSGSPRVWTAAPALVETAGPALRSSYCTTCARDSNGRIARSETAKHEFEAQTGYPHGRPGYVVDHIIALKRGGADTPANMQWQTRADAKAKDKWE